MNETFVRIEPSKVIFPATYVKNVSRITLKIYNETNRILNYEWRQKSCLSDDFHLLNHDDMNRNATNLLFASQNFLIEPMSSEIWPNRFQQIVVSFAPSKIGIISETGYIFDKETSQRLSVSFQGAGLPAQASFNIDTIHAGHIELHSIMEYQVQLVNTGLVDVDFSFLPYVNEFIDINFFPSAGNIDAGANSPIIIKFKAIKVGQFHELFKCTINGNSQDMPSLSIQGKVVGPSYKVSKKSLNFGDVGYGFKEMQMFEIINTSTIPLDFFARMVIDGSFEKREFLISPNNGTIPKHSKQMIRVEFIPIDVRQYSANISINALYCENVETTVSINATCICPPVFISNNILDFGQVFIGQKISKMIQIVDDTSFPAKFEFLDPRDPSKLDAIIQPEFPHGIITGNQKKEIGVYFTPLVIGEIKLKRLIRIIGSTSPPLEFFIRAECIGPKIEYSCDIIDFGQIRMLEDHKKTLFITNNSSILSKFEARIESDTSAFSLSNTAGIIEPSGTFPLVVTSNVNDFITFYANLIINFDHLIPKQVKVTARGSGTSMISSIPMDVIDIGSFLTGERKFFCFKLMNKGLRNQEINWVVPKNFIDRKDTYKTEFIINPEKAIILPNCEHLFEISILSDFECVVSSALSCISTIGKKKITVFSPQIKCSILSPRLHFSNNRIEFLYNHNINAQEEVFRQTCFQRYPSESIMLPIIINNSCTNISKIDLHVNTSQHDGFRVDPSSFHVKSGETIQIAYIYDPAFKKDFLNQTIHSKIVYSFENTSVKQLTPVSAKLVFPSIKILPKLEVNFGIVPRGNETKQELIIENDSSIDTEFFWVLDRSDGIEYTTLFDIYPNRGFVKAAQKDIVYITFFSRIFGDVSLMNYKVKAICHLKGGTSYEIVILAQSGEIQYTVNPKTIDFGHFIYSDRLHSSITINNLSNFPLSYSVRIPQKTMIQSISLEPMNGFVESNQNSSLSIFCVFGNPGEFSEKIILTLGNHEDVIILIKGISYLPLISISLPKHPNNEVLEIADRFLSFGSSILKGKPIIGNNTNYIHEEFVASRHIIEMGDIILGEEKSTQFWIESNLPIPLSYTINSSNLKESGFLISPSDSIVLEEGNKVFMKVSFLSNNRKQQEIGNLETHFALCFDKQFLFLIHISYKVCYPSIIISHDVFDYDHTIIGHSKVFTFHVQNRMKIKQNYDISLIENGLVVKKGKNTKASFSISNKIGELNPESYQYFEVIFNPNREKPYYCNLSLKLSFNPNPYTIQLKGHGMKLSLQFTPNYVVFPPAHLFSEPQVVNVILHNYNHHPIEVYSTQFDALLNLQNNTEPVIKEEQRNNGALSKSIAFSICIIVNGPPKSGKSSISQVLSQYYNLPIVSLRRVWEGKDQELDDSFYSTSFSEIINQPCFQKGFIIDGLDFFVENTETIAHINQLTKHKTLFEELSKNPFMNYPHQFVSSYERSLSIVLSCMKGHFVFHVAIQVSEEAIMRNICSLEIQTKQSIQNKNVSEAKTLVEMDEETYLSLSELERECIDKKRELIRETLIGSHVPLPPQSENRKSRATHRIPQLSKKVDENEKHSTKRKSKSHTPDVEVNYLVLYQVILGSICYKLKAGNGHFRVIDLSYDMSSPSVHFSQELSEAEKNSLNKFANTVLIDNNKAFDVACNEIQHYFPQWNDLSEKCYAKLIIPSQSLQIIRKNQELLSPEIPPDFFKIISVEIPKEPLLIEPPKARLRRGTVREIKTAPVVIEDSAYDTGNRFLNRWKIPPNSQAEVRIQFFGIYEGEYTDELRFRIVGSHNETFILPLQARCSYPDIIRDPIVIFPKCKSKFTKNSDLCFIQTLNEFHFGNQIILKERTSKNSPPGYSQPLVLRNSSDFTCDIHIVFQDNGMKSPWLTDRTHFQIPSGQDHIMLLGFHPTSVDRYQSTVSVFIKDNPEPFSFGVVGYGCSPIVEVFPQTLDFERIIVNQHRSKQITLKNSGKVPSFWRLKGYQQLSPIVSFSSIEGIIQPGNISSIDVKFISKKANIFKKSIQVDIFDKGKNRMFNSHLIPIIAESFDVSYEFTFPKPLDHLFYGSIKVGQSKSIICQLRNKGKYATNFHFSFIEKMFSSYINISPSDGVLNPGDKGSIQVVFSFLSNHSIQFESKKIVQLMISDPNSKIVIDTIMISVSVLSCYSNFNVIPEKVLDFGSLSLNETHSRSFQIVNTGLFPFTYKIFTRGDSQNEDIPAKSKNKNTQKTSISPRIKNRKKNTCSVLAGSFSVSSSSGQVTPGETSSINVEYSSQSPIRDSVELYIQIQDYDPVAYPNGYEYEFRANVLLPEIITEEFEKIFLSIPLCLRYELSTADRLVFLEDEQVLHFPPMVLKDSSVVPITLVNQSPINCSVDLFIKPKARSDSSHFPFSLNEKSVELAGNGNASILISFNPTMLQRYFGIFEAIVRLPSKHSTKSLKFGVEGVGALPSITLASQAEKIKPRVFSVQMGRTNVGYTKEKAITIINSGFLPARVRINASASPDFSLIGLDTSEVFTLDPQRQITISILFTPQKARKSQFDVMAYVIDNTSSDLTISFTGDGYCEPVVFEGIPTEDDTLCFKDCIIGRKQVLPFYIKNLSGHIIRYVFEDTQEIKFTPKIGHLANLHKKEILATFFSDKPVRLLSSKINCNWTEISHILPQNEDWDSSMTSNHLENNSMPLQSPESQKGKGIQRQFSMIKRVNMSRRNFDSILKLADECLLQLNSNDEPPYDILPNCKPKDMNLKATVISDIIRYEMEITEIAFSATMMFQTRIFELSISNPSMIRFEYEWTVCEFVSLRTEYCSMHTIPFSIEPKSGVIEAGQSTIFRVLFSPEDVDDFTAYFVCNIPYMKSMSPPKVFVSGISKRPLCHFNVELSDYLSSGRRHPTYTSILPEGINVIEVFAKGIGQKSIKKLEMINTTLMSYEVKWSKVSSDDDSSIVCESPSAFVASGKRYSTSFCFKPKVARTIESMWEFSIPSHNCTVGFLIVGRIMPN